MAPRDLTPADHWVTVTGGLTRAAAHLRGARHAARRVDVGALGTALDHLVEEAEEARVALAFLVGTRIP